MDETQDNRPEPESRATWLPALTLTGYGVLTAALGQSWGFFSPAAVALVTSALALWLAALGAGRRPPARRPQEIARWLAWLGAMASAGWGLFFPPSPFLAWVSEPDGTVHLATREPATDLLWLLLVHGAALTLVASYLPSLVPGVRDVFGRRWRVFRTGALFLLALLGGGWILTAVPEPTIDVWMVRQQGAELLLSGRSPYGDAIHVVDTATLARFHTDYMYPPLDLLLGTLGRLLGGDVRWASVAAVLLAAALLRRLARRRTGPEDPWPDLLAVILLFHPGGLFVVEQAWGEPLALPFLAAFALLIDTGRRWAAGTALGLLASVKQYCLLFVPFAALLPAIGLGGAAVALAAGAATFLPFLALDPAALWADVVVHHLENPFRPDALTIAALLDALGLRWPTWIGLAAPLGVLAGLLPTALRRSPALRGADVVLATTVALALFFFLGRQAFLNYYYLVSATALTAAALGFGAASRPASGEPAAEADSPSQNVPGPRPVSERTDPDIPEAPLPRFAPRRSPIVLAALLAFALPAAGQGSEGNWPAFRGPSARGLAEGSSLPARWNLESGENVLWRTAIPGMGHSSPIVWGDRVFVTTAVSEGESELVLGDAGGIDLSKDLARHRWWLYCLDKRTGEVIWRREAYAGEPRASRHVKSSQANATPVTDGETVVAIFGPQGIAAFDFAGHERWRTDLGILDPGLFGDPSSHWGHASSPILFEDRVIVQVDRHRDSFLAALDLATGTTIWKAKRDEKPIWATPTLHRGPERTELIVAGGDFDRGYDPRTGEELWRFARDFEVKTTTPIVADGLIVLSGGYRGQPLWALRVGVEGDVSLAEGETKSEAVAWTSEPGGPYTSTPLAYDGLLYFVRDTGIFNVLELATGERLHRSRLESTFSASPVGGDGKVYLTGEDGVVTVVSAGRQPEVLARNDMGEAAMATPAVSEGVLFIRTRSRVVAIAGSAGASAGGAR